MFGRKTAPVVAALISGLASIAVATPSFAQEPPLIIYGGANVKTERVGFADVQLASASEQKRLKHRVGGAIERVCDIDLGRDGLQEHCLYASANSAWECDATHISQAVP